MKRLTAVTGLILSMSSAIASAADWRQEGTEKTRLDNLVRLVPGASHWMAEMGERYQNLYWAAKLGKWEFAVYQAEEIEALVNQVALARPKRAASAQMFLDKVFPMLHQAVGSRNWAKFEPAFAELNAQCMACHVREEHAFVVIPQVPATAHSPVLNLE